MRSEWVELIVALLIALPGILGLLVQYRNYVETANKTKKEALKIEKEAETARSDAADKLVDTALSLNAPLQDENARLLKRNKYLEKGVKVLIRQLKRAGLEPEFDPSNGNSDSDIVN